MTILPDVCRAGANLAMFDLNNLKAVSDLNWKNGKTLPDQELKIDSGQQILALCN